MRAHGHSITLSAPCSLHRLYASVPASFSPSYLHALDSRVSSRHYTHIWTVVIFPNAIARKGLVSFTQTTIWTVWCR
ncbi:hypothetical protein FIBSPDRAFT_293508 [Athelia psychrophila]|uniref:Uncharacterized protein n=1 Tax=Athelia psychrophila TaxID=1759441 RepID=A0A166R2F6_9AGAM|nr:hypothetical protein FIBSPDRAFT_293508 [Fibularhizoctonia sp. CBS 109695]